MLWSKIYHSDLSTSYRFLSLVSPFVIFFFTRDIYFSTFKRIVLPFHLEVIADTWEPFLEKNQTLNKQFQFFYDEWQS